MTREQFLSGAPFTVGTRTSKGEWTYQYQDGMMVRQSRSSINDEVITYNHECNVDKVGKVGFKGFTFVFNKKVNVSLRFEDLVQFIEEA